MLPHSSLWVALGNIVLPVLIFELETLAFGGNLMHMSFGVKDTPTGLIGFANMVYLAQTAAALAFGLGFGEFARFLAAGLALASLLDAATACRLWRHS